MINNSDNPLFDEAIKSDPRNPNLNHKQKKQIIQEFQNFERLKRVYLECRELPSNCCYGWLMEAEGFSLGFRFLVCKN
ncbi:hypothetical protein P8452_02541 [Trifolium repens]|nr:hypothetical protein P8452_02541 [Trifolium repens]